MRLQEIAVLSAGNGGQTMAADLALAGFRVNLYELPQFSGNLKPLQDAGGLTLSGIGRQGFARLNKITADAREAVETADLVMVASALPGHEAMVRAAAPHMHDGQVMVFNTGHWSALRFQHYFTELGIDVTLAETAILVYLCVISGPAQVRIDGIKATVQMAAFPGTRTPVAYDLLSQAYPTNFTPASSILETNTSNINLVFHPAIVLGNLALIERTKGDFTFYREGVTPAVARLVDAVDRERMAVASALGLDLIPTWLWLQRAYGAKGDNMYDALHSTPAYEPSRYTHVLKELKSSNFINEDVPYGLVPIISLAEMIGVPTPTMWAITQALGVATERDHMLEGLTMEKLGIKGLNAEQIVHFFIEGK